jgi:hypothetical protein
MTALLKIRGQTVGNKNSDLSFLMNSDETSTLSTISTTIILFMAVKMVLAKIAAAS